MEGSIKVNGSTTSFKVMMKLSYKHMTHQEMVKYVCLYEPFGAHLTPH